MTNKYLTISFVALVMASSNASADMMRHEYSSSISGTFGCKMPINPEKPMADECHIEKNLYETGTVITKQGDRCVVETRKLLGMEIHDSDNQLLQKKTLTPSIEKTTKETNCNDLAQSPALKAVLDVRITKDTRLVLHSNLVSVDTEHVTVTINDLKFGLDISFIPKVQADNRIKLDIHFILRDLEGMDRKNYKNFTSHKILMLDQNKPVVEQVGDYSVQITARALTLESPNEKQ
jgi:hypothetical protein